jgi:hypothetical protein
VAFLAAPLPGYLVLDQGHDHAVKVEKEHDQVETELGEGFPLVDIQLAEDLRGVQQVSVVKDLLYIPREQRQIQDQCHPVSVDKEQESQETMDGGLRDDVGVKTVAEIYRVDVITFEVAVHDGEKDLEKEVDGIYQYRQQVQPRFARHHGIGMAMYAQLNGSLRLVMTKNNDSDVEVLAPTARELGDSTGIAWMMRPHTTVMAAENKRGRDELMAIGTDLDTVCKRDKAFVEW